MMHANISTPSQTRWRCKNINRGLITGQGHLPMSIRRVNTMSQHEVLLGELQMYSDSLREWGEKLREEDVCSKIMSETENKDEMLTRYNMCKSLNLTAHETCWRPLEADEQTTGHGTL